jgi:hypothetical protein
VQRGDETVGVVEVADVGGGTGVVLLDWVSERLRDFTPGEFVYRHSGAFDGKPFTRLVIEPGQHDEHYLERVGFRAEAGRWVRDLVRQSSAA